MQISILIESDNWLPALGADAEMLVKRACKLALLRAPALDVLTTGQREKLGLSVVLTDDTAIRELNKQYRAQDKPTNVLSFPAYENMFLLQNALSTPEMAPIYEDTGYLGDILLAHETIAEEAKDQGKQLKNHFCHLLVHGTLHLLGYDHINPAEANEMEALEIDILKELSIANPYE